jgi:hypothetical protein
VSAWPPGTCPPPILLALEAAYCAGQKPVTPEIFASVLAQELDDVEPTLARHGYGPKALAEVLQVRPAEIRAFLRRRLPSGRKNSSMNSKPLDFCFKQPPMEERRQRPYNR